MKLGFKLETVGGLQIRDANLSGFEFSLLKNGKKL